MNVRFFAYLFGISVATLALAFVTPTPLEIAVLVVGAVFLSAMGATHLLALVAEVA